MSISDNIQKANAQLYSEKLPEKLQSLSLDEMANAWASEKQASANSNSTVSDSKERFEQSLKTQNIQNKINEYINRIANGDADLRDFENIAEFCSEFKFAGISDEVKHSLDSLKEKMDDKRLNLANPVNIKLNSQSNNNEDALQQPFSINISADRQIVSSLDDKKLRNGKTITFNNSQNETLAKVAFDKQGNALLSMPSTSDKQATSYSLDNSGHLSRINADGSKVTLSNNEFEHLNGADKQALQYIITANKEWKNYVSGALDKNIIDSKSDQKTTLNEDKSLDQKTTINEDKSSNKTTENNDSKQTSTPNIAYVGNGNGDEPGKKKSKDQDYWKEGDIIDTMYKEWLLAFLNWTTDSAIKGVEHILGVAMDCVVSSRKNNNIDLKPDKNSTVELDGKLSELFVKNMENNTPHNQQEAIAGISEQLQQGKIDKMLQDNPAVANLKKVAPDLFQSALEGKSLSNKEHADKVASWLIATSTAMETYANRYAQASILDEKIHNKDSFSSDKKVAKEYGRRKTKGYQLFIVNLKKHRLKDNSHNPDFIETMSETLKEAENAVRHNARNISRNNYNEVGGKPVDNIFLEEILKPLSNANQRQPAVRPNTTQQFVSPEAQSNTAGTSAPMGLDEAARRDSSTHRTEVASLGQEREEIENTMNANQLRKNNFRQRTGNTDNSRTRDGTRTRSMPNFPATRSTSRE